MYLLGKLIRHPASSLLLLQATSFLTPWMIVVWLSFQDDVNKLAEFSLLLAVLSPLTLLLTAPSRNYMLSDSQITPGIGVFIRLVLMLIGLICVLMVAPFSELWLLALLVYLYKTTEFLFDFNIVKGLRAERVTMLWQVVLLKLSVIVVGSSIVYSFVSIELGLAFLASGFAFWALVGHRVTVVERAEFSSIVISVMPLSASALVFSIYFNIPRYILGAEQQSQQLAVYTVTSFIWIGLLVMVNAICQSKLHFWTQALEQGRFRILKNSILKVFVGIISLFAAVQVFHFSSVFSYFWSLHNDIHQHLPQHIEFSRLVVILSIGPILFSVSNYLLMVIDKHRVLFKLSLLNAFLTATFSAYLYQPDSPNLLIWVMAISGISHFLICSLLFVTAIKSKM